MIWVRDVPQALEFYTSKLGFEETYSEEDADGVVEFAVVVRGGVEFHLQVCVCDDQRHTGNTFLEVDVDDVAAIAEEYEAAGVEFVSCLTEEDWGKCCKITDPDGNWIMFSSYN